MTETQDDLTLAGATAKAANAVIEKLKADNDRLRRDGEELIAAIERQLSMHGKGIEPSDRVKEAIAKFRRESP